MHGDSGEHEDGLIRNQGADDAEHQQREDREVSVVREKEIDMSHALTSGARGPEAIPVRRDPYEWRRARRRDRPRA